MATPTPSVAPAPSPVAAAAAAAAAAAVAPPQADKTLLVKQLPPSLTKAQLEEACSALGPVKWCFVVTEKAAAGEQPKSRGFGYVQYAIPDDAKHALTALKKMPELGSSLVVTYAKPKQAEDAAKAKQQQGKKPQQQPQKGTLAIKKKKVNVEDTKSPHAGRLIIRNLHFLTNEDLLRKLFKKFGTVDEVVIPRKDNPKTGKKSPRGFAFVQYANRDDALKAMQAMNGHAVHERPIAVDLSLPKDQYEAISEDVKKVKVVEDDEDDDEEEEDEEEEDDDDEEEDDDEEDEEEDVEDEEDEEDDDEEEEDEDEDDQMVEKKTPKTKKEDIGEGKTLFIRNLSFESKREELEELCSQYGKLHYCLLVTDKDTGRPRGTAFVKFSTSEAAQAVLDVAGVYENEEVKGADTAKKAATVFHSVIQDRSASEGLHLHGRRLNVTLAIDRAQATQINTENETKLTKKRDRRNLYLAREGYVKPDSPEFLALSKGDQSKRTAAENEKKAKLKNPNFSVSKTRLSVRNLPLATTDKDLRKLFASATRQRLAVGRQQRTTATSKADKAVYDELDVEGAEAKVFVKQAKIVRSAERNAAEGGLRSRGFGFVEFSQHAHALAALRQVNNNPSYFGSERRPIVEFAIDNAIKLKTRFDRHTKQVQGQGQGQGQAQAQDQARGRSSNKRTATQAAFSAAESLPSKKPKQSSESAKSKDKAEGGKKKKRFFFKGGPKK